MKDRAEYAQKGIARGRSLVATTYDVRHRRSSPRTRRARCTRSARSTTASPSAGWASTTSTTSSGWPGVRHADTKGYAFSREDVDARSLANLYAQYLGNVFTHEMKPLEVEILVAELGDDRARPAVPHRLRGHDHRRGPLRRARRRRRDHRGAGGGGLAARLGPGDGAQGRRGGAGRPDRTLAAGDLEVAILSRGNGRRTFRSDRATRSWHNCWPSRLYGGPVERRIFGVENEYGVTFTLRGQRRLSPDEVARYLFRAWSSAGAARPTCSWRTAPGSTSTSAATPSTPPPSATGSATWSPTTRQGSGSCAQLVDRCPGAPARGGHPRRRLPLQEQHRLGRQLLRLPRELPDRAQRRVQPLHRGPHPVPGLAARSTPAPARCSRRRAAPSSA